LLQILDGPCRCGAELLRPAVEFSQRQREPAILPGDCRKKGFVESCFR
jgi:hypothetical protein